MAERLKPHFAFLLIYLLLSLYLANFYISNGITMGKDGGAFFLITWDTAINEESYPLARTYDCIYFPFYLFLSVFHGLGVGGVAFIYWFLVFFFAFTGSYLLCGKIIDVFSLPVPEGQRNLACFLVSLAFVLSPIAVVYRWGDFNGQSMTYGTFPLFCYLMLDIVFEKKLRNAMGKALLCSLLMSVFSFGLVNAALPLVPFFVILFNYQKVDWKQLAVIAVLMFLFLSWAAIGFFSSDIWSSQNDVNVATSPQKPYEEEQLKNHYADITDPKYILIFYPIWLYGGLTAYAGYYQNALIMGLWVLFILSLLAASIHLGTKSGSLRYIAFCLVVLFFAYNLSAMPKGMFGGLYDILVKTPLLWNLKSSFDRFNFFLQFALIPLALNFVLFAMNQKQKAVKTALLAFFMLAVLVSGFPLLSGQSADDKGQTSWKAHPSEKVLAYLDELGKLNTPASDFYMLAVPSVKGPWIYTSWYSGYDYLSRSPGWNRGNWMKLDSARSEINNLMESPTLAVDDTQQQRLFDLLRMGNYRYITLRGDANLSGQNNWPPNPNIRNQPMNLLTLAERYNFTVVYDDLDLCRSKSIITMPRLTLPYDRNDDGALRGEVVFRGLNTAKPPYIRIAANEVIVIYKQDKGIYVRQNNGSTSYRSADVPAIHDLDWQNLSFDLTGTEPMVRLNGKVIRMESTGTEPEWMTEQKFYILLNRAVIESCGESCTIITKMVPDESAATEPYGLGVVASECPFTDPAGYRIYENPYAAGAVFFTDGKSVSKADYRFVNPKEYVINGPIPSNKFLVLSQTYFISWEARFFKADQLVMRERPFEYKNLTAFDLPVDYDRIVLRYGPQDIVELSRNVSILSWVGCFAVFLFWGFSGKERA